MMDIASMLEVQVNEEKEVDSKENVTPKELPSTSVPGAISEEEYNFYRLMFGSDVSAVRFHKLHCTACDVHIGSALGNAHNMYEHPILRTLLCSKCRDFYGDGTFEQGDDATDMFCRWCANGGNLYCCSFCSNTFCSKCIKRNFDPVLRKKIEADERWKCFVCDPTDLYTARATCWALLQHVQTVNSFLQNNCKLSQEELHEKMSTDESQCCPRRKKRKRRRNSEEDDVSYSPTQMDHSSKRGRRSRGRARFSNGSKISVTDNMHGGISEDNSTDQSEILPSLLSCEQTMVECENATVSGDGRIISQNEAASVPRRVTFLGTRQTTYTTPIINVVPNSNLMPPVSPVTPLRHLPGSLNHSKQTNQTNLYQGIHSPLVPNRNITLLNRPHSSKPNSQTMLVTTSSNVIEIESDPEEVTVVRSSQNAYSKRPGVGLKAVPVALVSSKNNYDIARKQELHERRNAKTLNQRLIPHGKDIDHILVNIRKKFQGWFEISKRDELKKYEPNDGRCLIKQFHREVRDTVTQLAYINDRIVREYNRWKRYQMYGNQSSERNDVTKKDTCNDIPLDMTCTAESDSDSETGPEATYIVMNPSDLITTTNAVAGLKVFKGKKTMDRAVGDSSVLLMNKSVQISDGELQDYDNCIKRSTGVVDQVVKISNTQKSSVKHSDKQYRSYEEHFIQFLENQSVDAQSVETEKSKTTSDPSESCSKNLAEAVDNSTALTNLAREESKSKDPAMQTANLVTCKKVDHLVKKSNNISDDLNKEAASKKPVRNRVSQDGAEIEKGHCSNNDKIKVANVLKIEKSPSTANIAYSEGSNEDDCTIID